MTHAAGARPDAIVVGGGFAGLAAASLLSEEGARVLLLEARPHLGGRARSWIDPDTGSAVDNGQHVFLGCYGETLAFLRRIGSLDRLYFQPSLTVPFLEPGGAVSAFALPRRPWFPWSVAAGCLRCPGLTTRERLGLLRVAARVRRLGRRPAEVTDLDRRDVTEWLGSLGQGRSACDRLWHPLAIAALNEEPGRASAAMLLPVLAGLFMTGAAGARLGVPRVGLSDLYVEPAAQFLKSRGGEVHLRSQVRQLLVERDRVVGVLLAGGARHEARHVIVTTPPDDLLEMLPPEIAARSPFDSCARLETSPIVSVYLWFGSDITDLPFAGLVGGGWQWLFNRRSFTGRESGGHAVTLVRSAARSVVDATREGLVDSALEEVRRYVPAARRAALRHALVIKERRACVSPRPGGMALRPPAGGSRPGLYLAGDWTGTGLPATIESAVVSGHACAREILGAAGTAGGTGGAG